MKEKYKGYTITYQEHTEEFVAEIGESQYRNRSLTKVKKYIDNLEKEDFERSDVFVDSWRSDYSEAVVTSEVHSYREFEVWITFKRDKKRLKVTGRHVFLDNDHNRAIINSIRVCDTQIAALNIDKDLLIKKLEMYVAKTKPKENSK